MPEAGRCGREMAIFYYVSLYPNIRQPFPCLSTFPIL